jgi:hypothetical protein
MTDQLSDDDRVALIFDELPPDIGPAEAADVARLADALSRPSAWAQPRATLEDLVVSAVLGAPRTEVASVTALRPTAVPQHRPRPRRRHRVLLSAAAAIAAVAIAGGALVSARDHDPANFKGRLTAEAIAPGARGAAEMYKSDAGFRVELDARGLPRLAVDEYYQAWLTNEQGTEVPIGTFSASGGAVTLWSGVSPEQFPEFTITIEAADNNQNSSRRRVLSGEMRAL